MDLKSISHLAKWFYPSRYQPSHFAANLCKERLGQRIKGHTCHGAHPCSWIISPCHKTSMVNSEVPKRRFDLPHTIPETGIFSYVWLNFLMVNVCRDTNHMMLWLKDNKKASCSSHDISATMTTMPCLFWTTDVKTRPKNRLDFLKIHTHRFFSSHRATGLGRDLFPIGFQGVCGSSEQCCLWKCIPPSLPWWIDGVFG